MKVNRLETHDRLLTYQKQQQDMGDAVMECVKNVPDGIRSSFYVYGHSRSVAYDEKVNILQLGYDSAPDSRLIWMPVITKPKAAPNTYLFLANRQNDIVEIIWLLPKRELWEQYAPGNMFHNESIWISIQNFLNDRGRLEAPDKNGPTEKDQEEWFKIIGHEAHKKKKMKQKANDLSKLVL
jgi:hypothetical protein